MNRKVNRIDENGFYLEDVILSEEDAVPFDCIGIQVPDGFWLPKWDTQAGVWVEGRTQEEIAGIKASITTQIAVKAQAIEEINRATTIAGLKAAMLKYINAE